MQHAFMSNMCCIYACSHSFGLQSAFKTFRNLNDMFASHLTLVHHSIVPIPQTRPLLSVQSVSSVYDNSKSWNIHIHPPINQAGFSETAPRAVLQKIEFYTVGCILVPNNLPGCYTTRRDNLNEEILLGMCSCEGECTQHCNRDWGYTMKC